MGVGRWMRETGKCVLCTDTTQLIWVYYEYMYIRMCYICTPFLSLSITFVVSKEGLRLLLFSPQVQPASLSEGVRD